jgi:hypothetical protein
MNYSQFLDFCKQYDPALWNSMPVEERLVSNLCDFNDIGFSEKQWNWLNGAKLDWVNFARSASEDYANKISEFTDGGINETLHVDSFVSGRDSFPPPMTAIISFDYEKFSQVRHYDEKFTICIDGKLIPQDGLIECSDEYVKYDFTKEEPFTIPKFVKKIPLSEHTRQQMLDWCQNSPKWTNVDKKFWDVVPIRILATTHEFESLKGRPDSVVIHSYTSEDMCPPNVWIVGTFTSENGDKHKFSLYHDSDSFRYVIDEVQCKSGLVRTIKVIDFDRFYCVSPETKQILIKRGWAFDDSKACRSPMDCADSSVSLDRTEYSIITIFSRDHDPNPRTLVLQIGVNETTYWKNESGEPVTLTSEDGRWSTGTIPPHDGKTIKFNQTAFYKYRGDPQTAINGRIAIISDQTGFLPIQEKLAIAREIIKVDMGNPITGIGIGNADNVLDITIHENELKKNPNAEEYYKKRYQDMIPFDVPIRMDFGHFEPMSENEN